MSASAYDRDPRDKDGDWLPLMEYSIQMGVSLSTLRRYIKANKITYRLENGKYLLLVDGSRSAKRPVSSDPQQVQLQDQLRRAREEIAELKMLVALYEEKSL